MKFLMGVRSFFPSIAHVAVKDMGSGAMSACLSSNPALCHLPGKDLTSLSLSLYNEEDNSSNYAIGCLRGLNELKYKVLIIVLGTQSVLCICSFKYIIYSF